MWDKWPGGHGDIGNRTPATSIPYNRKLFVTFGAAGAMKSRITSTAIVALYIQEGFVIAADGRQRSLADGATKEEVQKIFSIEKPRVALAYAFAGTSDLPNNSGECIFDFAHEMANSAESTASVG
jgi:hypothetical protein